MTEQGHLNASKTHPPTGDEEKGPKQKLKDRKTQALAAALRANLQRRKSGRLNVQSVDQNTNSED
jgi:hypothetical protein